MSKSILARLTDGTVQLTITIPKDEVKKAYEKVLAETVEKTEIPGFRKGKAPQKLVEEKTDKNKIYELVLQKIIPQIYIEAVEEHKIQPIMAPKIELLHAKEEEDWEIRATTCERPEVELGNYKEAVKKGLSSNKIWTPSDEAAKTPNNTESAEEEKMQKLIQTLLDSTTITLPAVLTEDELNRTLSNLISQTEKLGLTIDQYLSSIGKTTEQIRAEYQKKVEDNLKLEFILDAIANQEKIEVSDKEIDALVTATGDEKLKSDLNSGFSRTYLQRILARRKTLDFLTKV